METTAEARGEVFILVLKNKDDIYSWLFGGALAMAQTAADGNGAVAAEIVVDDLYVKLNVEKYGGMILSCLCPQWTRGYYLFFP